MTLSRRQTVQNLQDSGTHYIALAIEAISSFGLKVRIFLMEGDERERLTISSYGQLSKLVF